MKKRQKKVEENIDEGEVEFYNNDDSHDFSFDTEEDFSEKAEDTIKKLKSKLKKSEREKIENLTGWQRAKADYINLKKRSSESGERTERYAKQEVIQNFFPALESLEHAMKGESWDDADEKWKEGVLSIYRQFLSALTSNGVEEVGEKGEPFNPHIHTSVSVITTEEQEKDHTVAEVLQKGYRFTTGEIIRSPKVVVFQKSE
ncbi:MAG: nucleotide exchange factor GrpE [Candidatus Paceibacterota bacterium]